MNCIIIEDNIASCNLIEEYIKRVDDLDRIFSFHDPVEAINKLRTTNIDIDLIFLDIEMPEMSGFDLLNVLRSYPQVIITTAQEKYAVASYNYDITDYLHKPISFERFLKAVEKAFLKFESTQKQKSRVDGGDNSSFYVKTNHSVIRLKYENVIYIEALENYIIICTTETKYTVLHTMKSIEEKVSNRDFRRVHRSFIVNLKKILKLEKNKILVMTSEGEQRIPVSKSYKKNLMESITLLNVSSTDI